MFTICHDPLPDDDDRYLVKMVDIVDRSGYAFHCDYEYLGTMEDELHRWREHRQRVCMVTNLAVNPNTGHCRRHAKHHMAEGHCLTVLTNPPGSLAADLLALGAEAQRLANETHGPSKTPDFQGLQQPSVADSHDGAPNVLPGLLPPSTPDPGHSGSHGR